jgi:hypothetical protein
MGFSNKLSCSGWKEHSLLPSDAILQHSRSFGGKRMQYLLLFIFSAITLLFGASVALAYVSESTTQQSSVSTSIRSSASTGGNSARGGDGASGADGSAGTVIKGVSRSSVETSTVIDGFEVASERHKAVGGAGESVRIETHSRVENGDAESQYSIQVDDRVGGSAAAREPGLSEVETSERAATSTSDKTEVPVPATQETLAEEEKEETPRSMMRTITGFITNLFAYVGSFFS